MAKVKKINMIDKRWAINLEDLVKKADKHMTKIEEVLTRHAKVEPVATAIRNIQSARRELAAVSLFAHFTKQIAKHVEEVRG